MEHELYSAFARLGISMDEAARALAAFGEACQALEHLDPECKKCFGEGVELVASRDEEPLGTRLCRECGGSGSID